MAETSIEWTDRVWNPVRGCSRVSSGCDNCYAMRQAHRFTTAPRTRATVAAGEHPAPMPGPYAGLTTIRGGKVDWTGVARFVPGQLAAPLSWKKPQRIFVNSMSDLFHHSITDEEIAAVFGVMAACPQHTFQILTKRPDRMREWFAWMDAQPGNVAPGESCARLHACMAALDSEREHHSQADSGPLHTKRCADPGGPWPLPNVWLGVSCEDQQRAGERIPLLLDTPAAVRFVSAEPLLGPITFDPRVMGCVGHVAATFGNPLINWVIVGGESGHGARPCDFEWIRSIVGQCKDAGVACFVKQLGGRVVTQHPMQRDALLAVSTAHRKGGDPAEWPEPLRVRQMPEVRRA